MKLWSLLFLAALLPSICLGTKPSCPIEIVGFDLQSEQTIRANTGVGKQFYPRDLKQLAAIPVEDLADAYIESPMSVLSLEGNIMIFPGTRERFFCEKATEDYFVVVDLSGRRLEFRKRVAGSSRFHRESYVSTNEAKNYPAKSSHVPSIEELATAQLRGSTSWLAGVKSVRKKYQVAQESINKELLSKWQSGGAVTRDDIQRWTEYVTDAIPASDDKVRRKSWVIRGTVAEFERDGKQYKVDMNNVSVWLEYLSNPYSLFIQPMKAEDVPQALDEILSRFNALTPDNSFEDAVAIYRDYLICHPTLDANGRIGRALLDHAMMKIGYSPVPKFPAELTLVLFQDLDGATREIIKVYENKK